MLEYLTEHPVLFALLAVFLVIIIALIVLLAIELVRAKKKKQEAEASETPEVSETEKATADAPEAEKAPEAPAAAPEAAEEQAEPAEAKAVQEEPDKEEDMMKKPETKKPAVPAKAPAKAPAKKPAAEKPKAVATVAKKAAPVSGANGKWSVYKDGDRFGFSLVASNGEVMLESATTYSSLSGAKAGIKTYQTNISEGRLEVKETKNGYRVQILNKNGGLHAASADYKTRANCESAAESIKRWALSNVIVVEGEEERK